jgi:hypothetical protein
MKMVESIKLSGVEKEAVSHNPYSEGSGITYMVIHTMSLMVLVEQV